MGVGGVGLVPIFGSEGVWRRPENKKKRNIHTGGVNMAEVASSSLPPAMTQVVADFDPPLDVPNPMNNREYNTPAHRFPADPFSRTHLVARLG